MHRLALLTLPMLGLAMPAMAGDLGPYHEERTYHYGPASRVVERERIIERHYYEPAPAYRKRVYIEPRVHAYHPSRVYAYEEPRPHYHVRHWRWRHHHHSDW